MSYFMTGALVRNMELTSHHQQEEFRKGQQETGDASPYVLPKPFLLEPVLVEQCVGHREGPWVRMIGQRQPGNLSYHHIMGDCEPRGRVVLWGRLYLSARHLGALS